MDLLLLLVLIVAAAAAGLAGDALGRARAGSLTARVSAERDALRAERDGLRAERDAARAEWSAAEGRAREAATQVAALSTALQHERVAAADKVELLRQADERLRETFGSLSAEALARNNEAFVQLAQSRLGELQTRASGDLTQRQQAIDALVAPLRDSLSKVQDQLSHVERARTAAYAGLQEQVRAMSTASDQLRTETAQLVAALRAPQVRGRWGEMQLRRVVEAAGMLEHCDFSEQVTVGTADGALRPDLVVHLAGGKRVVVDAKVAFSGYLEAMEARDEATRATRLKAHARHLRQHIDQLGDKAYWQHFEPTPEFVVLFVPADAFLQAALEEDPTLLEHAFARNVVLSTPANLVTLLRTIAYTWRQEALAANAQQVLSLGRELHGRLATMGTHMSKLGNQLGSAVDAYNKSVSSLESRVLVTARKFGDLHVTDEALDAPRQVEIVARQLQAPELVASVNEQLVVLPEPATEPDPQPHARGAGTG